MTSSLSLSRVPQGQRWRILYVVSDTFPYHLLISDDAGARFAESYGFPISNVSEATQHAADVLIVDNRLARGEFEAVRALALAAEVREQLVFFKIVDPVWSEDEAGADQHYYDFLDGVRDIPNVHFLTVYEPAIVAPSLFERCERSTVVHLPYAYNEDQELMVSGKRRHRKIFLSGQIGQAGYPLRTACYRLWRRNPIGRLLISYLPHPGYPDIGQAMQHAIVHGKFLHVMARFQYAFVCGSRKKTELQKYRECAYAGCAPIGELASSLADCPVDAFIPFDGTVVGTMQSVWFGKPAREIAQNFRSYMRLKRNPENLVTQFHGDISKSTSGPLPARFKMQTANR